MKFSEQWLREWVNPSVSTEQLCHQLTMAGLEVDAVEPVAGAFDNIVVGEVLSVDKHPDADKLRVCTVDVATSQPLSIVCGAANVAVGMKVPTALIGAELPGGLKIKKSKLRGVESFGMLCSSKEIGLTETAEGLMPLAADAPIGEDIRTYLKLDDVAIELGLTPNRGDCLSIEGIAREVGVLNRENLAVAKSKPVKAAIKDTFPVTLTAAEACPQYFGRVIKGINPAAETPLWMQERLRRCGLRSLSPVVDVTNYVLLELGQPMHAFDLQTLSEGIEVRYAKQGESLSLLDGQDVTLLDNTLVIADQDKAIAMAGIMGGADTAVSDGSSDIFLESAFFAPLHIAGKARQYGLHTDSSHRFERGVSPELQQRAIEYATQLLLDIVGGEAGPLIQQTLTQHLPKPASITLREARIERLLGAVIPAKEITEILKRLGMEAKKSASGWQVTAPAFRFDIEHEVDLIEEIIRIFGYDNLPLQQQATTFVMHPQPEEILSLRRICNLLVDLGYQQAITYSFVDPKIQTVIDPEMDGIALANPISSEMAVMRTNLWSGLIQAMQFNLHRQQNRLLLFEYGLKFTQQAADIWQEMVLAGLVTGEAEPKQWGRPSRKVDFYDVKGQLESLFRLTGQPEAFRFEAATHPALHPGQSARILMHGKAVGWLGLIHPAAAKALELRQAPFLFELSLTELRQAVLPKFREISKYPTIRRDLSFLLHESTTAQQVLDCVENMAIETLVKVELFDAYTGEGIDSGRKSLSLGLTLQDLSRTLTEADVERVEQQIIAQLDDNFGATLRE